MPCVDSPLWEASESPDAAGPAQRGRTALPRPGCRARAGERPSRGGIPKGESHRYRLRWPPGRRLRRLRRHGSPIRVHRSGGTAAFRCQGPTGERSHRRGRPRLSCHQARARFQDTACPVFCRARCSSCERPFWSTGSRRAPGHGARKPKCQRRDRGNPGHALDYPRV